MGVAVNPRLCYIDLKDAWVAAIQLVAAYFPDSTYPDHAYEAQLEAVAEVLRDAKTKRIPIMLGTDLNAQLGGEKTCSCFVSFFL